MHKDKIMFDLVILPKFQIEYNRKTNNHILDILYRYSVIL